MMRSELKQVARQANAVDSVQIAFDGAVLDSGTDIGQQILQSHLKGSGQSDVDVCKTSSTYKISLNDDNNLSINGTARADFTNTNAMPQRVDVTFTFQAIYTSGDTAGSGRIFRQVSLKLLDRDPCNLIYVTYRVDPWYLQDSKRGRRDQLKVQTKKNVGMHSSSDCGNGGYTTLGNVNIWDTVERKAAGQIRVRLLSVLDRNAGTLKVQMWRNGVQSADNTFDITAADWLPHGGLGIRTDNVDASMVFAEPHISGQVRLFNEADCQAWDAIRMPS